jgi:hypothetical protein
MYPQDAYISFGIPDLKGINDAVNMKINDTTYSLGPGIRIMKFFLQESFSNFP